MIRRQTRKRDAELTRTVNALATKWADNKASTALSWRATTRAF
jgi:hypothetical protein